MLPILCRLCCAASSSLRPAGQPRSRCLASAARPDLTHRALTLLVCIPSRAQRIGHHVAARFLSMPASSPFSTSTSVRSGHNRWSKIRHRKGAADAARSAVFSRLTQVREVPAPVWCALTRGKAACPTSGGCLGRELLPGDLSQRWDPRPSRGGMLYRPWSFLLWLLNARDAVLTGSRRSTSPSGPQRRSTPSPMHG